MAEGSRTGPLGEVLSDIDGFGLPGTGLEGAPEGPLDIWRPPALNRDDDRNPAECPTGWNRRPRNRLEQRPSTSAARPGAFGGRFFYDPIHRVVDPASDNREIAAHSLAKQRGWSMNQLADFAVIS